MRKMILLIIAMFLMVGCSKDNFAETQFLGFYHNDPDFNIIIFSDDIVGKILCYTDQNDDDGLIIMGNTIYNGQSIKHECETIFDNTPECIFLVENIEYGTVLIVEDQEEVKYIKILDNDKVPKISEYFKKHSLQETMSLLSFIFKPGMTVKIKTNESLTEFTSFYADNILIGEKDEVYSSFMPPE
ncbi:hypothetical protein HOO14_03040 [bacterium]|jgi:hypothetical protein|nr:hypothetical protein [bacterium]